MIDMAVGDDKRLDVFDREINALTGSVGLPTGCFRTLKQAAVDEDSNTLASKRQLMASTGYTVHGAMVLDPRILG